MYYFYVLCNNKTKLYSAVLGGGEGRWSKFFAFLGKDMVSLAYMYGSAIIV